MTFTDGGSSLKPEDLAFLKRMIRGEPVPPESDARLGPRAQALAGRLRAANGTASLDTLDLALREWPDGDAVRLALLADQPFETTPELPRCPSLPDSVRLDPARGDGAGSWVDRYTRYGRAISPMTPNLFHEGAAIWLGAVTVARRLVLPMSFAPVYPNLFVAWVAPSTLFRKSTGMDLARRTAWSAIRHLLTPQDTTPEALVSDLAGREPSHFEDIAAVHQELWRRRRDFAAQRGLMLDEFSGLLASAGRDYNAGLLELYMRAFDCTEHFERITRGQGLVVVRDAYLSLLGASTPAALGPHLSAPQLWANGWWPRFALLCPPDERPAWHVPTADPGVGLPFDLTDALHRLDERLPRPSWPETPPALPVRLDQGAFELWQPYSKALTYDLLGDGLDDRLHAAYGRLPTQALKIATILAALDWPDRESVPRIMEPHMMRAMTIAEDWRASFHRLLELTVQTVEGVRRGRLIRLVARAGLAGLSLRDIWRGMRDVDVDELQKLADQAVDLGELDRASNPVGTKGGRPSKGRYCTPGGEVLSGDRRVST